MIRIENLEMTYRSRGTSHKAVRGISLSVEDGTFYTLLGPSGCGKTTTLRCVAGLERPDSGEIVVADEIVYSSARGIWVPPHKRRFGMVFQSYAIWPHMSVFQNVAFPLRYVTPTPTAQDVRNRVRSALALVKLEGLEDRPAPFLSGGQQQRLALARALVGEPNVLLLDEPLSNLDAKLREEMRAEIADLVRRINVTTLYVTHDQSEALTMSNLVAVMKDGRVVQEGPPAEIYARPRKTFVANFVGKTNMIGGVVAGRSDADRSLFVPIETEVGTIEARADSDLVGKAGAPVTVCIRPENIYLEPAGSSRNGTRLSGHVKSIVYLGNMIDCVVGVGAIDVRIHLHPSRNLSEGLELEIFLPAEDCLAIPREEDDPASVFESRTATA